MRKDKKIIQFFLIFIGVFLIVATYFYYPAISSKKNKELVKEEVTDAEVESDKINTFEKVEYKGFYDLKPFTVSSDKASVLKNDPDIVYMTSMKVIINMNDDKIITITSDRGNYNKVTYDCFFVDNVKAVDGNTVITADNLDLLSTEDFVSVYNDVVLINEDGSLLADKVDYNFEKKYYQISMFKNEKVKIKINQ